jgi:hypothetical protein
MWYPARKYPGHCRRTYFQRWSKIINRDRQVVCLNIEICVNQEFHRHEAVIYIGVVTMDPYCDGP